MISPARHRAALHRSGLIARNLGAMIPGATLDLIARGWKLPRGMLPAGTPGFATATPVPGAPVVPGPYNDRAGFNQQWTLVAIAGGGRPLVDGAGTPLMMPDGTRVGAGGASGIRQWCDTDLASGCVLEARALYNDAVLNFDGSKLVAAMSRVMDALSSLNLEWSSHPVLRVLWRRYMSGPAATPAAEFDPTANWNDACQLAGQPGSIFSGPQPRTFVGTNQQGLIPAAGRAVFNRCFAGAAGRNGQWMGNIWPGQQVPPGSPLPAGGHEFSVGPTRDSDLINATSPVLQNALGMYGVGGANDIGRVVDANCVDQHPPRPIVGLAWSQYAYDESLVAVPLRFASAWADYVAWTDAVITALETTTAAQAIADCYLYVAYLNAQTLATPGGANAYAAHAASISAEFAADATAQADLGLVRSAAPAISAAVVAAIGVATGAAGAATAGVGAIIVGSVAMLTLVAQSLWPPDLTNVRLDDLCRPRPWFQRNWLAGSPSNVSALGAPTAVLVGEPAGFVRGLATLPGPTAPTTGTLASMSGDAKVVLGVGAVALAAYAARAAGWLDAFDR